MFRKNQYSIAIFLNALTGMGLLLALSRCSEPTPVETIAARTGEIRVVTSTNGIIEPLNSTRIYAAVDGFVQSINTSEGARTSRGQTLFQMDSPQTRIALAEARAALLETKRQSRVVLDGPPKEELDSLDATLEESSLQLSQLKEKLSTEESLLSKGAVSLESVKNLREQVRLLQMQLDALKKKKENILTRYTETDKKLMRDKIKELTDQVQLLEGQLRNMSVVSPVNGLLYSLEIKQGSFVTTGQLLAQIYQPGQVRLKAYVDEPDLGRIQQGQPVTIEWDGMPDMEWEGMVETPPGKVVALNNRSVGYVLCSLNQATTELIPDINVDVEIVTAFKENALVVPRSSVFRNEGESVVLLAKGDEIRITPVVTGLQTFDEIEIVEGIEPGDQVVLNPLSAIPENQP